MKTSAAPRVIRDLDQRSLALDPRGSFIVQAPAGSGKTELLVRRILTLLTCVDEPESIVAITFTKKAAGEMLVRVMDALREARDNAPIKPGHEERRELALKVLARSAEKNWELLRNPDRLRITTIDSLCNRITRQMPLSAGMGGLGDLKEKSAPLLREAARRTIMHLADNDEVADAVRVSLLHRDNNVEELAGLIEDMLKCRDQWMRHLKSEDGRSRLDAQTLRTQMEGTLRAILCEGLERAAGAIRSRVSEIHLAELARYAAENVEAEVQAGNEKACKTIALCKDLHALPPATAEAREVWLALMDLLLTKGGELRKRPDKNSGFPPGNKTEKGRMETMLAALAEAAPILAHVRELPPDKYDEYQWEVMRALLVLLPTAVEELRGVFAEEAASDFTEVALSAIEAVGGPESPTRLAEALGHRIQHLLVDEFQDTNVSQVSLLETLVANWTANDGRTVFLVGDPMQSIYRFREAEVGLFLRAWGAESSSRGYFGPVTLQRIRLESNFRSDSSIVNWVNEAVGTVFPRNSDPTIGAVSFSEGTAVNPKGDKPGVTVHSFRAPASESRIAEYTANLVAQLRKDHPEKEIAILVRSRGHEGLIPSALRKRGLRYRAVNFDPLADRVVVNDLMALTLALAHDGDRTSWLSVLRAPWCGLGMTDLFALCGHDERSSIWKLMCGDISHLSDAGRAQLERIIPVLRAARAQRGRKSLRLLVESTWITLGGPACLLDNEAEDAERFFSLLESLDAGGELEDLSQLAEEVDELWAESDAQATKAIQLMTIHGAKGLEFDFVIVPGLESGSGSNERELLRWEEFAMKDGAKLVMAPIAQKGTDQDSVYKFLSRNETLRSEHERARLLYVAATRAKEQLHLIACTKHTLEELTSDKPRKPREGSFLAMLWDHVGDRFIHENMADGYGDMLPGEIEEIAAASEPVNHLRRMNAEWQLPAGPPPVEWTAPPESATASHGGSLEFSRGRDQRRRVGTVTHAFLHRIAEDGVDKWNAERVEYIRKTIASALALEGLPPAEIACSVQLVEQALKTTLSDERGRWILSPHKDAYNEHALTGLNDGKIYHVSVDRTFINGDVRWIIDYKTSSPGPAVNTEEFLALELETYREQLEHYANLLSRLEPGRQIKLGLYFPLIGEWVEWEP